MMDESKAYLSKEEVVTEGQRAEVIRFKNPNKKITFNDLILGDITVNTTDLGDFVIAKDLNTPIYHTTSVIDDFDFGITHVIRGQEHTVNTIRQILIGEAIGASRPIYAHIPLILNSERAKLSKRDPLVLPAIEYREMGYLPEAIINFLALIGWNPGNNQEFFTISELIEKFDLSKVQKGAGIFNPEKLDWLNREYIIRTPFEEQFSIFNLEFSKTKWKNSEKVKDRVFMEKIMKIMLDRMHRWGEVREEIGAGDYDYLFENPVLDKTKIMWKTQTPEKAKENLEKVLEIMELPQNSIRGEVMKLAEKEGKGETLWPLRYALSGREKSPDPFTLIEILGVEETKKRIQNAIQLL
jgi:glutamyl-tRNA synthetase